MILLDNINEISSKTIYVFGAGVVAKLFAEEVKRFTTIKIEAFLISGRPYEKESKIKDINVISIDDAGPVLEIPVIVATLSNLHVEIENMLIERGIKSFVGITENMFRKMRSHIIPLQHDRAVVRIKLNEMRKMYNSECLEGIAITSWEENNIGLQKYSIGEFIDRTESIDQNIYVYNINWEENWKGLLKILFETTDKFVISYRLKFLQYGEFSLLNESHNNGFKLVKAKKISRNDYYTEDAILLFEKNTNKQEITIDKIENNDYKYDVGLVGIWNNKNYGAELTYYALYSILKKMGKRVLMIEWAEDSILKPHGTTQLFENEPYDCYEIAEPIKNHVDFYKLNDMCDVFIQGSDQLLNPYLYEVMGHNVILDWVDTDKKKISYAMSFGHDKVEYDERTRKEMSFQINLFDAISVREDSAVSLMKEMFDVEAFQVLDAVFLLDKVFYENIASRYLRNESKELFAYILDPEENTEEIIEDIAIKMELHKKIILDANRFEHGDAKDLLVESIPLEEWIADILNSKYVITDSFHGMCLAIICKKQFVAVCNSRRGETRFKSILKILGLENRLYDDFQQLKTSTIYNERICYEHVDKILKEEKEKSLNWLTKALNIKHETKISKEFEYMQMKFRELEKKLYEVE